MFDLAGNDVGWRLRIGRGITGSTAAERAQVRQSVEQAAGGRSNAQRYSILPDKLCESNFLGQKAGRGWYLYDPSNPRKAIENESTLRFIEEHRAAEVRAFTEHPRG